LPSRRYVDTATFRRPPRTGCSSNGTESNRGLRLPTPGVRIRHRRQPHSRRMRRADRRI